MSALDMQLLLKPFISNHFMLKIIDDIKIFIITTCEDLL
jgi:hypothetical protein